MELAEKQGNINRLLEAQSLYDRYAYKYTYVCVCVYLIKKNLPGQKTIGSITTSLRTII